MAMGLVSDDEFEKELGKRKESKESDGSIRTPLAEVLESPSRGRKEGDVGVPDSLRQVIASTALMDGRQAALDLADDFGISPSSVSAYTKGATSTTSYHSPKPTILDHIKKSRQRAITRASKTLNSALGSITQDKLDYADAKDLSSIAKDMSAIIRNLEPKEQVTTGDQMVQGPQFVIYAPQFKKEESFEVIEVTE